MNAIKKCLFSFLLAISIFALILMSMSTDALAVYTFDDTITCYSIYAGQQKGFGFPPWHMVEVSFAPMKAGNWNLFAWTNNYFQYDPENCSVIIEFYWRDGPRDSWHHWRTSTFSIYNYTHQHLYSGSSSIEYKFKLYHFMDSPTGVTIAIE